MNASDSHPKEPEKENESLTERSARLEAEASAMLRQDRASPQAPDPLEPEPEAAETLYPQINESNEKVTALRSELDQAKDQMIRALAEADNARKRAVKEREDASKYAIAGFAKDMLEVSDNLRRALEAVPEDMIDTEPRLKNLVDGIAATERTLLRSLERNGIQKIEPLHEIFDPNFHEVMFEISAPDHAPGTVVQLIETGYMLRDRLLRPARVGVAKDEGQARENASREPGGKIDTQA